MTFTLTAAAVALLAAGILSLLGAFFEAGRPIEGRLLLSATACLCLSGVLTVLAGSPVLGSIVGLAALLPAAMWLRYCRPTARKDTSR